MRFLAVVSGGLDDFSLALCKSFDEARALVRLAMTDPKACNYLTNALRLSGQEISCLVCGSVVTFDDLGTPVGHEIVTEDMEEVSYR